MAAASASSGVGHWLKCASAKTRAAFGWQPQGPGLLQDMREGGYFD